MERGIGQLKRRFHVLHGEIRQSPEHASRIIMACGILHNICKARNIPLLDDDGDDDNDDDSDDDYDGNDNSTINPTLQSGDLFWRTQEDILRCGAMWHVRWPGSSVISTTFTCRKY